METIEKHPLGFFLPRNAHILFLGSFPPPRHRWSMDFYYPNFINDFWRLHGLIFFRDKDYFIVPGRKAFDRTKIMDFCQTRGIALGDTAVRVIRRKGNASDAHLEVVEPLHLSTVLPAVPDCRALVTTGQKAMDTLLQILQIPEPRIGDFTEFAFPPASAGSTENTTDPPRRLKLFRMPSTSRAYPKPLPEKAEVYRHMYESLGIL